MEADISRETGASRMRVREALRRLSVEGIVAIEAFRGASVKRFSQEEVLEIGRARETIATKQKARAAADSVFRS